MSDDWDDDYPETSMDDAAYDEYVQREFGRDGGVKGDPPILLILAGLVLLVLVLAVYLLT